MITVSSLRGALDGYATHYLASHGIDEPATWSPPLALVGHLDLPGRDIPLPDLEAGAGTVRGCVSPSVFDVSPQAVIGRLHRLAGRLTTEVCAVYESFGLSEGEFDVLAALRRAGTPSNGLRANWPRTRW